MVTIRGVHTARFMASDGKDGRSVTSIMKYYLTTSASSGITTATSGWNATPQTMDATSKYLWTYEIITYSDKTTASTTPVISGAYGDKGDMGAPGATGAKGDKGDPGATGSNGNNGCIVRSFQNGIVVGQTYRNDINASGLTEKYLDIVFVEDSSMATGYAGYQCLQTYTATAITDYTNTTYWTKLSVNATSAFLTYLIAKNAFIKLLSGAQFVVLDSNNNVAGGMQGDPSLPVFWAGATKENIANAPFKVLADGTVIGLKMQGLKGVFDELTASSANDSLGDVNNMLLNSYLLRFNTSDFKEAVYIGEQVMPAGAGLESCARIYKNKVFGSLGYVGNCGMAIDVTGASIDDSTPYIGNHALYITHGDICGFRLHGRRLSSGNIALDIMDTNIICVQKNNGDLTLTLPSGCEDMHEVHIRNTYWDTVIYTSSGSTMSDGDRNTGLSSVTNHYGHVLKCLYDAHNKVWFVNQSDH